MHACIPWQTLCKQSNVPWLNSKIVRHMLSLVHVLTLLRHLYLQVMMLPTWFMIALRIYCVHIERFWASTNTLDAQKASGPDGISVKVAGYLSPTRLVYRDNDIIKWCK